MTITVMNVLSRMLSTSLDDVNVNKSESAESIIMLLGTRLPISKTIMHASLKELIACLPNSSFAYKSGNMTITEGLFV
jgi:hypothetical protein